MAITTQTYKISYLANGATKVFAIPFLFLSSSHIHVYLNDVEQFNGFIISGVNTPAGGSIMFNNAPAASTVVLIRRLVPYTQELSLINEGQFPAKEMERSLDKLTMEVQQLDGRMTDVENGWEQFKDDLEETVEDIHEARDAAVASKDSAAASASSAANSASAAAGSAASALDSKNKAASSASASANSEQKAKEWADAAQLVGIPENSVENKQLVNMPAKTVKANLTNASTSAQDVSLLSLRDAIDLNFVDIPAASTMNVGAASSNFIHLTVGSGVINSFGTANVGVRRKFVCDAGITLKNSNNLLIPGYADYITLGGDYFEAVCGAVGSGVTANVWRIYLITKRDGTPVVQTSPRQYIVGVPNSGTWTAPYTGIYEVSAIGGGGGGGAGVGGANGGAGGNTTFGSSLTAYGGGGGYARDNGSGGGGGGGATAAGVVGASGGMGMYGSKAAANWDFGIGAPGNFFGHFGNGGNGGGPNVNNYSGGGGGGAGGVITALIYLSQGQQIWIGVGAGGVAGGNGSSGQQGNVIIKF